MRGSSGVGHSSVDPGGGDGRGRFKVGEQESMEPLLLLLPAGPRVAVGGVAVDERGLVGTRPAAPLLPAHRR